MKKLLLLLLLIPLFCFPSEWVNVDGRDYKICKIDTIQQIIVCEGWYDISEVDGEYFAEHKGGFGNYFFYNKEKRDAIKLTKEKLQKIINDIYPKKEEL